MKRAILLIAVLASVGFSTMAHAALISRGTDTLGNRLIYDDDLNITWYDHWEEGSWLSLKTWAAGLDVNFGGTHYTDWRLPSAKNQDGTGPDEGFNVTSSEMGHLYYIELGKQAKGTLGSTGLFEHLIPFTYYLKEPYGTASAWTFELGHSGSYAGMQDHSYDDWVFSGIAVRDGDVAVASVPNPETWLGNLENTSTSVVPEPGTWLLMGAGLAGFAASRRRLARR